MTTCTRCGKPFDGYKVFCPDCFADPSRLLARTSGHRPSKKKPMSKCTRCGNERVTMPIYNYRPGGHSWLPLPDFKAMPPPDPVRTCGDCITDDEIVRELGPMMEFALGILIKNTKPQYMSTMVALETARALFMVRNNDPDGRGRQMAVEALGLGVKDE